jgi:hypothetical protein
MSRTRNPVLGIAGGFTFVVGLVLVLAGVGTVGFLVALVGVVIAGLGGYAAKGQPR